jgi:hypothetical protein
MSPEPAVVRLRGPADVLSSLPHLLGFHPTESLVIMCLSGPRRRQRLVMRVDLPAVADEAQIAVELAERVAHEDADSVVIICYTAGPDAGDKLPRADLVDGLMELLVDRDIEVHDAYLARGTRWWSYVCTNVRCCPRAGTELADAVSAAAGVLAAEAVWRGSATMPDRAALAASIEPDAAAVAASQQMLDHVGGGAVASRSPATVVALARSLLGRYREGGPGLSGAEAARMRSGLRDVRVRDEIATWGLDPDPEALLLLLTDLARACPAADAAPACTLLAWVAYLHGNGSLANVALDRALACEDAYSMALLLQDALAAQLPPAAIRRITAAVCR